MFWFGVLWLGEGREGRGGGWGKDGVDGVGQVFIFVNVWL